MLSRRGWLGSLVGLPFLGFLKPEKKNYIMVAQDTTIKTSYDLSQCFCSCGVDPLSCGPKCPNYLNSHSPLDVKPTIEISITMKDQTSGRTFKVSTISDNLKWEEIS